MNTKKIIDMSINKQNIALWILIAWIGIANVACSRVSLFEEEETVVEFVDMNLNMNVASTGIAQSTLERDERILYADLYLFQANSNGIYIFNKKYSVNEADIKVTDSETGKSYQFSTQIRTTTKPVMIYLVANQPGREEHALNTVDAIVPEVDGTFMITPEDLEAKWVGTDQNPIPMSGKIILPNGINTTTSEQDISLLRAMARVDLMKKEGMSNVNFKLTGMSVWFAPDRGRLFSTNIGASSIVTAPTMPETFKIIPEDPNAQAGVITSPIRFESAEVEGVKEIKNKIFIYENKNIHAVPAKSESRNSRIVVWGYYNEEETLSYYPIDFTTETDPNKYVDILRNHRYSITINGVNGAGYATERDAAYGDRMDISASVIYWTDNKQEIIFDGMNWFSIEKKEIQIGGEHSKSIKLSVSSSIASEEWSLVWGETGTFPTDETVYKKVDLLDIAGLVRVEKPNPPLISDKDIGVLTISKLGGNDAQKRYLFIKVNNRLKIRITVNILSDEYSIDDWEDGNNISSEL
jgi:hypothetical protein